MSSEERLFQITQWHLQNVGEIVTSQNLLSMLRTYHFKGWSSHR